MTDLPPPAPVEEHRFPCASCGSDMRFDPDEGRLMCDHCGATADLPSAGPWAQTQGSWVEVGRERDMRQVLDEMEAAEDVEETRVSTCPSCAAKVTLEGAVHATECPYCATPVVADTGTHRHIKPQGLVPFAVDEAEVMGAMKKWLGGLWFAPNGLQAYARQGRRIQGIYTPYWTYDARTATHYTGLRGRVYYVTTTGSDGKQKREQRIDWRPVSGRVARAFDDILVLGSRALPKRITDSLYPWDLGDLRPYQPEVIAGFQAEGYTVDLKDGYAEARDVMDKQIEQDIRRDIGGDRQRIASKQTSISNVTFKHILLPVWIAAYKYNGKSYRFVVNGQTGKVQGERPWSVWKIALAVIAGLALAGGVAYLAEISNI